MATMQGTHVARDDTYGTPLQSLAHCASIALWRAALRNKEYTEPPQVGRLANMPPHVRNAVPTVGQVTAYRTEKWDVGSRRARGWAPAAVWMLVARVCNGRRIDDACDATLVEGYLRDDGWEEAPALCGVHTFLRNGDKLMHVCGPSCVWGVAASDTHGLKLVDTRRVLTAEHVFAAVCTLRDPYPLLRYLVTHADGRFREQMFACERNAYTSYGRNTGVRSLAVASTDDVRVVELMTRDMDRAMMFIGDEDAATEEGYPDLLHSMVNAATAAGRGAVALALMEYVHDAPVRGLYALAAKFGRVEVMQRLAEEPYFVDMYVVRGGLQEALSRAVRWGRIAAVGHIMHVARACGVELDVDDTIKDHANMHDAELVLALCEISGCSVVDMILYALDTECATTAQRLLDAYPDVVLPFDPDALEVSPPVAYAYIQALRERSPDVAPALVEALVALHNIDGYLCVAVMAAADIGWPLRFDVDASTGTVNVVVSAGPRTSEVIGPAVLEPPDGVDGDHAQAAFRAAVQTRVSGDRLFTRLIGAVYPAVDKSAVIAHLRVAVGMDDVGAVERLLRQCSVDVKTVRAEIALPFYNDAMRALLRGCVDTRDRHTMRFDDVTAIVNANDAVLPVNVYVTAAWTSRAYDALRKARNLDRDADVARELGDYELVAAITALNGVW